jgi:hypothetical protein
MTFAPVPPTTHVPPTRVATDTFVVHQVQPALGQPLFVYLNSMVIRHTGQPRDMAERRVLARRT